MVSNNAFFKKLGLTKNESLIYKTLISKNNQTAKGIAEKTGIRLEAVYRPLRNLVKQGFVTTTKEHPRKYHALPPEIGVANKISASFESVGKGSQLIKLEEVFPLRVIIDREQYHEYGQFYFKRAQKEVLTIASGTGDLSAEFIKAITDTLKDGVTYKLLSLTLEEANREQLENWKKNGFSVRHKSGKGINLNIYDRQTVQMGFRVSEKSKEKYGIIITGGNLGKFLGEFFDYLSENAQEI